MILYENTKATVYLPNDSTSFFDIVIGVLLGDTLMPNIFIICLDYVLWMSIDLIKKCCFTLKKKAKSRQYPAETMTNAAYANGLAQIHQPKPNPYCIAWSKQAGGIYVNTNKIEFMCFKQGVISTLSGKPLKSVDQFTYLSSNISFTERDINICLMNRLLIIRKSDLSHDVKWHFL